VRKYDDVERLIDDVERLTMMKFCARPTGGSKPYGSAEERSVRPSITIGRIALMHLNLVTVLAPKAQ